MAKAKKQALGRGLSAILKDPNNNIKSASDKGAEQIVGNIVDVNINSIETNPFQPRKHFDKEKLQELASSIKELGVIQPLTVRKIDFEKYQLISGERRLRACKLLNLEIIPAYIRIANDQQSLEMALVENIQRKDLDPIEVALSYQRLIDEINLTQEEMSTRVGKKRSTITNYLRLLRLDPVIQTGMRDGFLSMGHGRALVNIPDKNKQLEIYKSIISHGISVRETEDLVKAYQEGYDNIKTSPSKRKTKIKDPKYVSKGKNILTKYFPKKANIKMINSKKGKIIIDFDSEKEFEDILKILKAEK